MYTEAMAYVIFIVAAAFLMKILWNFAVPYILAVRSLRAGADEFSRVSLMPYLELGLLAIAAVLSLLDHGSPWPWGVGMTALVGGALVVASYVHLVVAGAIAGWVVKRLRDARAGR